MDPVDSNLAVCEAGFSGYLEARNLLRIRPLRRMYPLEDRMGRSELAHCHDCNDRDHRMHLPQLKNNRALGCDSDIVENQSYRSGCDIQGRKYCDHHCHMAQESLESEEWPSLMER